MPTPLLTLTFNALLAFLALQRLVELRVAARNTSALKEQGAVEHDASGYSAFVVLHALFFAALLAEFHLAPWAGSVPAGLTAVGLVIFLLAQGLRYWALRTLGGRWTTRILVLPGAAPVNAGPYRFLRHPNYLAVILELLVIPLAFGLYATAAVFTVANALLLRRRIRIEEGALQAAGGYAASFSGTGRLVPRAPRKG